MSKALKFTNNNYLDSTSVVHERTPLNEILDNMGDSLPINSIFEYEGNTVPEGYEEVTEMSGSNSNGSWIKFASGIMICFCMKSYNITTPQSIGSLYYGYCILDNFPQPFAGDLPTVIYDYHDSADVIGLQPYSINRDSGKLTLTSPGGVYPITTSKRTSALTIQIQYIAIGRWK